MQTAVIIGFALGGSALIGVIAALILKPGHRTIAVVMAFGAGLLLSALSIELMHEGAEQSESLMEMGVAFFAGALVFVFGDWLIDRRGGRYRKSPHGMKANLNRGDPEESSGGAIFLGTLLDGIPESFVAGAAVAAGGASGLVFIVAVAMSNMAEAIAGTASMKLSGMSTRRIVLLWVASLVATVLSAVGGWRFLGSAPPVVTASIMAFASGAILAMLCDTMIPEAFHFGGRFTALVTVAGFLLAFVLSRVF